MSLNSDLNKYVKDLLSNHWSKRDGQKIPESEDIKLGNEAVSIEGTVLYADLDSSTNLVDNFKPNFSAKIYKSYLYSAARIIRQYGGTITSYDGDRIMAVYIGDYKNSHAAKTALKINYAVKKIINPTIKAQYKTDYEVKQVVGIDTSKLFVARTGIRGSNDLVWVGRAANYAAKLTSLSPQFPTRITQSVFKKLNDETRYSDKNKNKIMWKKATWNNMTIYRSTWIWNIK